MQINSLGPLPLGYACEANMHSKETHQLPAPMTGDTECNLEQVYHEMREFLLVSDCTCILKSSLTLALNALYY